MIDFRLCTGPVVNKLDAFSGNVQRALKQHYGTSNVHYPLERTPFPMSKPLSERGQFYKYISLDGRRITPLPQTRRSSAGSSIISAVWDGEVHVGELLSVFRHAQEGQPAPILFAEIRWLVKSDISATAQDPWDEL